VPYLLITDFSAGLDTRKHILASPPGTLTRLVNAAITPGGDIYKRRAFVKIATLTNSFGLASTSSTLYAFTRNVVVTPPSLGMTEATLVYQNIPNASTTLVQTDYDTYDGKIYLVTSDASASPAPNNNLHYYNGVQTTGSGKGIYVRAYQQKIYSVVGNTLFFSAVNDPNDWDSGTGAGSINLSTQDADAEELTSLEVYYNRLAIFARESVQLWQMDPDPLQNQLIQVLRGIGTEAPHSTLQYGSGDVLCMADSGIRSLRARDASNAAAISDIGSPIDSVITDIRFDPSAGLGYLQAARAILEPVVGRFWMILPTKILVLSYFPGPRVTAWSVYTVPFTIDFAVTCGGRVFLRSGDDLYLYGGIDGSTWDNCGVEVRLPYLDAKKPGHNKGFEAIDMTITGTWQAAVSYNFDNPDDEETLGTFTSPTWNKGRAEMQGNGSHFSLRFYNTDANAAMISNVAVHMQTADDEA
jgi:hypothetical protein